MAFNNALDHLKVFGEVVLRFRQCKSQVMSGFVARL